MAKRRNIDTTVLPSDLTVSDVATRSGVTVSALHFYESKGLIKSWRTLGNQRRYPRLVLRRVAVIKGRAARGHLAQRYRRSSQFPPQGTHTYGKRLGCVICQLES